MGMGIKKLCENSGHKPFIEDHCPECEKQNSNYISGIFLLLLLSLFCYILLR